MLSVTQLRQTVTRTEILTVALTVLKELGFATTSWALDSKQYTLLRGLATVAADLTELAKATVELGFNSTSKGAALTEFSANRFANTRTPGAKTRGTFRLTSTASIPYTLTVGQLVFRTGTGLLYTLVALPAGATISAGGTLDVTVEAEKEGAAYNVSDSTALTLVTVLAGVTAAPKVLAPWYSTTGTDPELDSALALRNSTKWSTLGLNLTSDGYANFALNTAGVAKATVNAQNPRGEGTVDVYVAAAYSLTGTAAKEALQLAYSRRVFGCDDTYPAGSTSSVAVLDAPTQELALVGVVYYSATADLATVKAGVVTALLDLLTLTPVGGWSFGPGSDNVLTAEQILEAIASVDGVDTAKLTTPSGSQTAVGATSVVIPPTDYTTTDWGLTYVAVAT